MKTAATKYTVQTADNASRPMSKASAERIAKKLRNGKGGLDKRVDATVVPVQADRSERGAAWE